MDNSPRTITRNCDEMCRVLPNFYLGGYRDARDEAQLKNNNITHIVSVFEAAAPLDTVHHYYCIQAQDWREENLMKHFSAVNDFIHQARCSKGSVLIHCVVGISRSATFAIAYVMIVGNLSLADAHSVVWYCRPIIHPNQGFMQQLKSFEECNFKSELDRFRQRFPIQSDPFNDRYECELILAAVEKVKRKT